MTPILDYLRAEPCAFAVLLSMATGCIAIVLAILFGANRPEPRVYCDPMIEDDRRDPRELRLPVARDE